MGAILPELLLEALKTLTTPSRSTSGSGSGWGSLLTVDSEGPQSEDGQYKVLEFDKLLAQKLNQLEEALKTDVKFFPLLNVWGNKEVKSPANDSPGWRFADCCVKLLRLLVSSLVELGENHCAQGKNKSSELKSATPAPSPDTLSVAQQKVVLTAIQFIVCLGIGPCLQPGVGLPMELRSELGRYVSISSQLELSQPEKDYRLLTCVQVLLLSLKVPSLGPLVLTKHLTDILTVLLQLCYSQPKRSATKGDNPSNDAPISADETESPASVADDVLARNKTLSETVQKPSVMSSDCSYLSKNQTDDKKLVERLCSENISSSADIESSSEATSNVSPVSRGYICDSDRDWCRGQLTSLLGRVYQPSLVRELLVLQGGPSPQMLRKLHDQTRNPSVNTKPRPPALARAPLWLRRGCGLLLTRVLLKPHGVQHILRGMLDSGDMSIVDWRRCEAVARVIANCPKQVPSVEEYYRQIAPQVFELLQNPDSREQGVFCRVGCAVIHQAYTQHPDLADTHLMAPLCLPIRAVTQPDLVRTKTDVLVTEQELSVSVENLQKVLTAGVTPRAGLVSHLQPLLPVLFELFCFLKDGVSPLRNVVQDALLSVFKSLEKPTGVTALEHLVVEDVDTAQRISPDVRFGYGSSGGVQIERRADGEAVCCVRDDERIQCVVELLTHLQTDGLAAQLFLHLLKELTEIIKEGRSQVTPVSLPIRLDSSAPQAVSYRRRVLLLTLLAEIAETLGPSCLKSSKDILEFIKVTLERGVEVCGTTPEAETRQFESETLSMALGLLTAQLGGAMEIMESDRDSLSELSPLLHCLESGHHDDSVREMASDLRVAIATHGAVWSSLLDKSAVAGRRAEVKPKPWKHKPMIEVSTSSTTSRKDAENSPADSVQEIPGASIVSDSRQRMSEESEGSKSRSTDAAASKLQQAFEEARDPLIPVRGHGLITLRSLVEAKNTAALEHQNEILTVFQDNLYDADSYLYLAAVNGLVTMATARPDTVVRLLAEQFANFQKTEVSKSVEVRMKLGECLVRVCRNLGDLLPRHRDVLLAAILSGARDEAAEVRASSLSSLAEVCRLLRFSLGSNIHEVLCCCSALLRTDENSEVRKAAGLALTMLLQGLGTDTFKVLEGVLTELYRLLKSRRLVEADGGVLLHIDLALEELDAITRAFLFPEQSLTKKILVSRPE